MRQYLRSLFDPSRGDAREILRINALRAEFSSWDDSRLREAAAHTEDLADWMALVAVVALRVLGQEMFDSQLRGALALIRGHIAEMQTGEGKTLAAVPAAAWYARQRQGVHVMTVNDYLARRDAGWMGDIYRFLGFSAGSVHSGMSPAERRAAYACDITYATANEIGFDFLRDRLAMLLSGQVHRPFSTALIDEADSILIDEARIPLVIAGGGDDGSALALAVNRVAKEFRPLVHYTLDVGSRNVTLTDAGALAVESAFGCGNLYDPANLQLLTAVQDALHAYALLARDVDYLVTSGAIEQVDEFKGRIALERRWPAGLHTALEAKEGVTAKHQGVILGSITLQHLVALYPRICGMTATASTQSLELEKIYGLRVEKIPTHRPMIRVDHADRVFRTRAEKDDAVLAEIRMAHAAGQPVLAGTGSVAESERLSAALDDLPHQVLNARNDELEASIIARAGERGAVTISTNMAGRGTDIRLGEGVVELGGLYVIGTNKHESSRIDSQLRGRAGRQGDPGCSRFFVSLEDELFVKYADLDPRYRNDPDSLQRLVEGRNLNARLFLHGYEVPLEGQRHLWHTQRQEVLDGTVPCATERERLVTLRVMDELWVDHLARAADFRSGVQWLSWGRRDPHLEYLRQLDQWFLELREALPVEIAKRLECARSEDETGLGERGAVWTYLTTDQPFGSWTERVLKGLSRQLKIR